MIKLASLELDLYSDRFYKELEKIAEVIPDFVKETNFMTPEELELLSDADFALCVRTADGEYLRRFPIVDKGHTWMSAYYFLRNKAKMPKEAKVIAATNIMKAVRKYNLPIPCSMSEELYPYYEEESNGKIYREDKDKIGNLENVAFYSKEKTASSNVYIEDKDRTSEIIYEMEKDAEQMIKEAPDTDFAIKTASGDRMFYIGTSNELMKTAAEVITNYKQADPSIVLDMAHNMVKKASELKVDLPNTIKSIHNVSVSEEMLKEAFDAREGLVNDEELAATLKLVRTKVASDNKETVVRFLSEFDKTAGLNYKWDVLIPHPISMLMHPEDYSLSKIASEPQGNDPSEEELYALAQDDQKLKELYDADMVKAFKENPREFYNALPDTHKDVIRQIVRG